MAITTNATVVFHQRQLGTNGGNFIYCIMPVSPALAIVTTFRNYHASSLTSVKYFHKSASLLPETSVISLCLICIYLDVTPWTQDALFSVATTLTNWGKLEFLPWHRIPQSSIFNSNSWLTTNDALQCDLYWITIWESWLMDVPQIRLHGETLQTWVNHHGWPAANEHPGAWRLKWCCGGRSYPWAHLT